MRNYISLIVVILLFTSCEKVLDLKLDNTEPRVVIESFFTDQNRQHPVSISYTTDFDAETKKIPATGATVVVREENGPVITFSESSPGNYLSARYRGRPGRKYTITVTLNGQTYTATSIMPSPVPIKSLGLAELSFFGNTRKVVQLNYSDPAGIANFYYTRAFVNGLKRDQFFVDSDRFTDGREVKNSISLDEPDLVPKDEVKIQFFTIDQNVYRFLFSITQITGNGGPPTVPANPTSNFNNGALGFFSASTFAEDTIVIN